MEYNLASGGMSYFQENEEVFRDVHPGFTIGQNIRI